MSLFFSDREGGPPARAKEDIDQAVWGGLYVLVEARVADGSFGYKFPAECPDGRAICGHNNRMLALSVAAQFSDLSWPLSEDDIPKTTVILDFLEFVAASVGTPIKGDYHSFFRHHHLTFDHDDGLNRFAAEVNGLFTRNGVAYELTSDGSVRRVLPIGLGEVLQRTIFRTGDGETDRLLETARKNILSLHENAQQDALEKLWDAFERLKTLEPGRDKGAQAKAMLDKAVPSSRRFRELLDCEATALTKIGNNFRIRHSETTQEKLTDPAQLDYLFTRMFAFILLILRRTGRGG